MIRKDSVNSVIQHLLRFATIARCDDISDNQKIGFDKSGGDDCHDF